MITVDSSVWIAAHRRPAGGHAHTLRALLDAGEVALALPVRIEFLSTTARKDRPRLRRALSALPLLYPTDDTWRLLEKWAERAHDAGHTFDIPDLLIGALTREVHGIVWSLDKDFEAMGRLGFVQLYE